MLDLDQLIDDLVDVELVVRWPTLNRAIGADGLSFALGRIHAHVAGIAVCSFEVLLLLV